MRERDAGCGGAHRTPGETQGRHGAASSRPGGGQQTLPFERISPRLVLVETGVWRSDRQSEISYPEPLRDVCHGLEDQSFWFAHRSRCLVEMIRRWPPAGPIVDVGGGNGAVTKALCESGFPAVLLEPSAHAVAIARGRGVKFVVHSTFEGASFSPGCLPAIGLFDVLEHIRDDLAFVVGVRETLEPGGLLYLTVPANRWMWSPEDEAVGHYRRYSRRGLRSCLTAAKLEVVFCSYLFAPLVLPLVLGRTLPGLLGFESGLTSVRGERLHRLPRGLLGRLLARLLDAEADRLRRGSTIPFGSSCCVVARRPRPQR